MKIHTNHTNSDIFGGGKFLESTNSGGGIFRPKIIVTIIVFLTFLGFGVKFSRWGKNSLYGVKIHQVGTSKTVKCVGSNS